VTALASTIQPAESLHYGIEGGAGDNQCVEVQVDPDLDRLRGNDDERPVALRAAGAVGDRGKEV
jgi:hypothetical protein